MSHVRRSGGHRVTLACLGNVRPFVDTKWRWEPRTQHLPACGPAKGTAAQHAGSLLKSARWCAQDLGYSPKVPLAEGVQRFCKWFKNYYDIRDGKPANIADFNYNPL